MYNIQTGRYLPHYYVYKKDGVVQCSPESDGVIAKSNWGSNTPAAMGMATTLYATAQDKFWYTLAIVACARSSASTICQIESICLNGEIMKEIKF